jgi:hypothetical protein
LLIHRANWSPHCLSACNNCSDSLIGGKCANAHLSNAFGCLDPGTCPARTEIFCAFWQEVARLTKPNSSLQGLENRYRAFKTPAGNQCLYGQYEKAKT